MGWTLLFCCILTLMLLAMIFGEDFTLIGMLEGRWFAPVTRFAIERWNDLCRAIDEAVRFIGEHLWWVVASVAGSAGLVLTAVMMFQGLSTQAADAYRSDMQDIVDRRINPNLIDAVPAVQPRTFLAFPERASETDESRIVWQSDRLRRSWGEFVRRGDRDTVTDYVPLPVEPPPLDSASPARSFSDEQPRSIDRPSYSDVAQLGITFERTIDETLVPDDEEIVEVRGWAAERSPFLLDARRLVRMLELDDWQRFQQAAPDPFGSRRPRAVPEATAADMARAEQPLTILPTGDLASTDLSVDRNLTEEGGITVLELTVRNDSSDAVQGLILREILPEDSVVLTVEPFDAVVRSGVVVWRVDPMEAYESRTYRMNISMPSGQLFTSRTEISAATAVVSPTLVRPGRLPPVERIAIPGAPDVRLEIVPPAGLVQTDKFFDVEFRVSNVGSAPADGVQLIVTLDNQLADSQDPDIQRITRRFVSDVRRLEPGESAVRTLTILALREGEQISVAEMLFEGEQLDLQTFRVRAASDNGVNNEDSLPDDPNPFPRNPGSDFPPIENNTSPDASEDFPSLRNLRTPAGSGFENRPGGSNSTSSPAFGPRQTNPADLPDRNRRDDSLFPPLNSPAGNPESQFPMTRPRTEPDLIERDRGLRRGPTRPEPREDGETPWFLSDPASEGGTPGTSGDPFPLPAVRDEDFPEITLPGQSGNR